MKPQTHSSSMQSKVTKTKPMKPHKASTDRHQKVDGRDRRIRLPVSCAMTVFELQRKLGHKNPGETVNWVVQKAKASVDAALKTDQTNAAINVVSQPSVTFLRDYPYQMLASQPMDRPSAPVGTMFPSTVNGLTFPAQDFASYGTICGTPINMEMGQPLHFQNEMQNSQSIWPRFL